MSINKNSDSFGNTWAPPDAWYFSCDIRDRFHEIFKWHNVPEELEFALWKAYCHKKLIFARHFPYVDCPEYQQYISDLKSLWAGVKGAGSTIDKQDAVLQVKDYSGLSPEENIYTPIFATGTPIRILYDQSGKNRNVKTANDLCEAFPQATAATIQFRGFNKANWYPDEFLNGVTELTELIKSSKTQYKEDVLLVVSNSSYAPVLSIAQGKPQFDRFAEIKKYLKEGVGCIDLNQDGNIIESKDFFCVNSQNYEVLSGLIWVSGCSYVDLQNKINFLLLKASPGALVNFFHSLHTLPNLQAVVLRRLLELENYREVYDIMGKITLSRECFEVVEWCKNYELKKTAILQVFARYKDPDLKGWFQENYPSLYAQFWVFQKLENICSRSSDPKIQAVHPLELTGLLSGVGVDMSWVSDWSNKINDLSIASFLSKHLEEKERYLLVWNVGVGKTLYSAWIAAEYLNTFPDRPIEIFEWRHFTQSISSICDTLRSASVIPNVLLIIDGLDEIQYDKRKEIISLFDSLKCTLVVTSRAVDFREEGNPNWVNLKLNRVHPLKFLLARAESYTQYIEWIQAYGQFGIHNSAQYANPLILSLLWKLICSGEIMNWSRTLSHRVIYQKCLRLIVREHILKKENTSFNKITSSQLEHRVNTWLNQLTIYAQARSDKQYYNIDYNLENFYSLAELDYLLPIQDGQEFVFAHKSFEEFFLAESILKTEDPIVTVLEIQKACESKWGEWINFLPTFRLVLDSLRENSSDKEVFDRVLKSWLIEHDSARIETAIFFVKYFDVLVPNAHLVFDYWFEKACKAESSFFLPLVCSEIRNSCIYVRSMRSISQQNLDYMRKRINSITEIYYKRQDWVQRHLLDGRFLHLGFESIEDDIVRPIYDNRQVSSEELLTGEDLLLYNNPLISFELRINLVTYRSVEAAFSAYQNKLEPAVHIDYQTDTLFALYAKEFWKKYIRPPEDDLEYLLLNNDQLVRRFNQKKYNFDWEGVLKLLSYFEGDDINEKVYNAVIYFHDNSHSCKWSDVFRLISADQLGRYVALVSQGVKDGAIDAYALASILLGLNQVHTWFNNYIRPLFEQFPTESIINYLLKTLQTEWMWAQHAITVPVIWILLWRLRAEYVGNEMLILSLPTKLQFSAVGYCYMHNWMDDTLLKEFLVKFYQIDCDDFEEQLSLFQAYIADKNSILTLVKYARIQLISMQISNYNIYECRNTRGKNFDSITVKEMELLKPILDDYYAYSPRLLVEWVVMNFSSEMQEKLLEGYADKTTIVAARNTLYINSWYREYNWIKFHYDQHYPVNF